LLNQKAAIGRSLSLISRFSISCWLIIYQQFSFLNQTVRQVINIQTVIVNNEEFEVRLSGSAWQAWETLGAVDGTIEIKARSVQKPERTMTGLIHGNLAREFSYAPFIVTISLQQISKILTDALAEWISNRSSLDPEIINCPDQYCIRNDAQWGIGNCAVPFTRAPLYAGEAQETLNAVFELMSNSGMQDWPLEVSDPDRLEEFCAFYDRDNRPLVKFDTMQLALYSYDARVRSTVAISEAVSEWFDRTLHRDFALHGNTVAYWARLERESDDPEFSLPDPEFVFGISGQLRRIWDRSLIPIEIHWNSI
jgi:hypothetical protein